MAYGVHWEWRGFGAVDGEREARILSLAPAAVPERTVTDTYLWHPRLAGNVKLRAWEGGGSLKVKRRLDPGSPRGPSLWMESPAEEYDLPLDDVALARTLAALGVDPSHRGPSTPTHAAALLVWLVGVVEALRLVEVRKLRRTFVWDRGTVPVLVELAEIERPERTRSVGIEDMARLQAEAPSERLMLAQRGVSEAATVFGGGLRVLSYPEAVAIWARGGSVAGTGSA